MSSSYRVLGGILLVAGSCIGAGMLATPMLTGLTGFFPSMITLAFSWIFMTYSALLVLEMNSWFASSVNLLSMVEKSLGVAGKKLCFIFYLILFYALLVAYIAVSGKIFADVLHNMGWNFLTPSLASFLFVLVFGSFVALDISFIDWINRFLMFGLVICFLAMVLLALPQVEKNNLLHVDWSYFFLALPVLVLSFGFQNLVPSLSTYLNHDWKKTQFTIVTGSLVVFFIYLVWQAILMGVVPFAGENGIFSMYQKKEQANGALQILGIGSYATAFAFFAIVTSFVAQALTLMHFIADGMHLSLSGKNRIAIALFIFPTSLGCALYNPEIFYAALEFSGGISAMVLFGILPVLAVWNARYINKVSCAYQAFGGKYMLIYTGTFACFLILQQCTKILRSLIKF